MQYLQAVAHHMGDPPRWWWLSFQDEADFRGVAIVRARFYLEALYLSVSLNLYPGGTVVAQEVMPETGDPPPRALGRLLTDRDEVSKIAEEWTGKPSITLTELAQQNSN